MDDPGPFLINPWLSCVIGVAIGALVALAVKAVGDHIHSSSDD